MLGGVECSLSGPVLGFSPLSALPFVFSSFWAIPWPETASFLEAPSAFLVIFFYPSIRFFSRLVCRHSRVFVFRVRLLGIHDCFFTIPLPAFAFPFLIDLFLIPIFFPPIHILLEFVYLGTDPFYVFCICSVYFSLPSLLPILCFLLVFFLLPFKYLRL